MENLSAAVAGVTEPYVDSGRGVMCPPDKPQFLDGSCYAPCPASYQRFEGKCMRCTDDFAFHSGMCYGSWSVVTTTHRKRGGGCAAGQRKCYDANLNPKCCKTCKPRGFFSGSFIERWVDGRLRSDLSYCRWNKKPKKLQTIDTKTSDVSSLKLRCIGAENSSSYICGQGSYSHCIAHVDAAGKNLCAWDLLGTPYCDQENSEQKTVSCRNLSQ